jgi:hypothetical protein
MASDRDALIGALAAGMRASGQKKKTLANTRGRARGAGAMPPQHPPGSEAAEGIELVRLNLAAFDTDFNRLTAAIRKNYPAAVAKAMLPSYEAARADHVHALVTVVRCNCRVCYWATPDRAAGAGEL